MRRAAVVAGVIVGLLLIPIAIKAQLASGGGSPSAVDATGTIATATTLTESVTTTSQASFVSDGYQQARTTNNNWLARANGTGGFIYQTAAGATLFQLDPNGRSAQGQILIGGTSPSIGSASFNTGVIIGGNATISAGNILQLCTNLDCAGNSALVKATIDYTGLGTFNGGLVVGSSGTAISKSVAATATIDVANITAATCLDTTQTVTGAAAGAPCMVGAPTAATANVEFSCYVSAADTVKLRACDVTASDINPASGSYQFRVFNP